MTIQTNLDVSDSSNSTQPTQSLASSALDPNTGAPAMQPALSPLQKEQQDYTDAWASDPTANAPVRTWRDITQQQSPDGQYLSAWYDQQPATQASGNVDTASGNANAIATEINAAQAATAAATPATSGGHRGPLGMWIPGTGANQQGAIATGDDNAGPGAGGGGPGDGSGIGSASSATGADGSGVGTGAGGSAAGDSASAGDGTSGDGSGDGGDGGVA